MQTEAANAGASERSKLDRERSQQRQEFREALDINTKILTCPENAAYFHSDAERLAMRHQQHYIAPDIVRAMLQLSCDKENNKIVLAGLRRRANLHGFFLMPYDDAFEMQRLSSPQSVIVEASGRAASEEHQYHNQIVPAADCQCVLPLASTDAPIVLEMPIAGDNVYEEDIVEELTTNPWLFGEVKDIATSMDMQNMRLAGAARSAAFDHIKNTINLERGEYGVNYIGACIAQVRGIERPDGTQILLKNFREESIKNQRSLDVHENGRYPAFRAFKLQHRKVPATVDGQNYSIIVSWDVWVHNLHANV